VAAYRRHRQDSQKPAKSLYERLGEISEDRLGGQKLGGAYKIAAIVSDLIDRLQVNEVISENPKIKKISGPAMPGHNFEFTLMICSLAGGPQKYAGRSLMQAHASLGITTKEWSAMLSELKTVLDKHKVPPAEQKEFVALIDGTAKEISAGGDSAQNERSNPPTADAVPNSSAPSN
jgi:hemoglobin